MEKDPSQIIKATQLMTNAAVAGTRLLNRGVLPPSAAKTVMLIQQEADFLRSQQLGLSKDGSKKYFMTAGLGAIVPPPTA